MVEKRSETHERRKQNFRFFFRVMIDFVHNFQVQVFLLTKMGEKKVSKDALCSELEFSGPEVFFCAIFIFWDVVNFVLNSELVNLIQTLIGEVGDLIKKNWGPGGRAHLTLKKF